MQDMSVVTQWWYHVSLSLSLSHQVRLKRTWRTQLLANDVHLLFPLCLLSDFLLFLRLYRCNRPPPPPRSLALSRSASCSWSNTPCCGWSNGTKSGVSVRFGPLQPATASWIQSADTSVDSKTQWSCGVCAYFGGGSLLTVIDDLFSLLVWCCLFPVWQWMFEKVNKRLLTTHSGELKFLINV